MKCFMDESHHVTSQVSFDTAKQMLFAENRDFDHVCSNKTIHNPFDTPVQTLLHLLTTEC